MTGEEFINSPAAVGVLAGISAGLFSATIGPFIGHWLKLKEARETRHHERMAKVIEGIYRRLSRCKTVSEQWRTLEEMDRGREEKKEPLNVTLYHYYVEYLRYSSENAIYLPEDIYSEIVRFNDLLLAILANTTTVSDGVHRDPNIALDITEFVLDKRKQIEDLMKSLRSRFRTLIRGSSPESIPGIIDRPDRPSAG